MAGSLEETTTAFQPTDYSGPYLFNLVVYDADYTKVLEERNFHFVPGEETRAAQMYPEHRGSRPEHIVQARLTEHIEKLQQKIAPEAMLRSNLSIGGAILTIKQLEHEQAIQENEGIDPHGEVADRMDEGIGIPMNQTMYTQIMYYLMQEARELRNDLGQAESFVMARTRWLKSAGFGLLLAGFPVAWLDGFLWLLPMEVTGFALLVAAEKVDERNLRVLIPYRYREELAKLDAITNPKRGATHHTQGTLHYPRPLPPIK
jgi:hypothetical protein